MLSRQVFLYFNVLFEKFQLLFKFPLFEEDTKSKNNFIRKKNYSLILYVQKYLY